MSIVCGYKCFAKVFVRELRSPVISSLCGAGFFCCPVAFNFFLPSSARLVHVPFERRVVFVFHFFRLLVFSKFVELVYISPLRVSYSFVGP